MIKLTVVDRDVATGIADQFVVEADEPVTIEVTTSRGAFGGKPIAHVYRGTDLDETAEPVGAYDASLPENKSWQDPPKRNLK